MQIEESKPINSAQHLENAPDVAHAFHHHQYTTKTEEASSKAALARYNIMDPPPCHDLNS